MAPARRAESCQLLVLLVLVALFYFVVIPAGIRDPDGFVLDQGLPPSFSARLVAGLAALILLARLIRISLPGHRTGDSSEAESADSPAGQPVVLSGRVWLGVALSLLFAFVLVPVCGFFLAALVTLGMVLFVLGERTLLRLLLFPLLVTTGVWLLFSQLLSVKLPVGLLLTTLTAT